MGPLFLILWMLAETQLFCSRTAGETGAAGKQFVAERSPQPLVAERSPQPLVAERSPQPLLQATPFRRPGEMSMYSVYVGPESEEKEFKVRCKTARAVNNIDIYVPIEAVADEDVVDRAGQILIPAGTKIIGRGYCDAEGGRILSRGKWTFYASDHQITADATLWDETLKEGLEGTQFSEGLDQERIKQAIFRDGAYVYVPSQTGFVLELQGNITVQDLPSACKK